MQQRQCFTQGENVELLAQYGLFLAKIATVVVAIAVIAAIIVNLAQRKKQRGELRVTNLSEHYKEMEGIAGGGAAGRPAAEAVA